MTIQRYEFAPELCDGDSGRCFAEMEEDADGDYVLYKDYKKEVDRLKEKADDHSI